MPTYPISSPVSPGEIKMLLNGGKLAGSMQMDRILMVMEKKNCPQGVVCPCPGAIYMYMTIIFKLFL